MYQKNAWKKYEGGTRSWTKDLSDCSRLLYHWAIPPCSRREGGKKQPVPSFSYSARIYTYCQKRTTFLPALQYSTIKKRVLQSRKLNRRVWPRKGTGNPIIRCSNCDPCHGGKLFFLAECKNHHYRHGTVDYVYQQGNMSRMGFFFWPCLDRLSRTKWYFTFHKLGPT